MLSGDPMRSHTDDRPCKLQRDHSDRIGERQKRVIDARVVGHDGAERPSGPGPSS